MKLLIVTRSFDQCLGGMEVHTRLLVEHFLDNGWQVTVATPDVPAAGAIFSEPRATYIRLGPSPPSLLKYSPRLWWRVRRLLVREAAGYDIVLNISMAIGGSFGLPRRLRAQIVSIAHGTYVLERRTLLAAIRGGNSSLKTLLGIPYTYLFDLVQRGVNRRSARLICVSENVQASLLEHYSVAPRQLALIRNFVPLQRFRPHVYDRSGRRKLLFLARLHREKGLFVLLKALDIMRAEDPGSFKQLVCYVAGEGPAATQAAEQAGAAGLTNVVFMGNVARERVPGLMAKCDVYVFPTLRLEGLPLSLLEAMAAGLPTVASDIEGPQEVIRNGVSGLLVAPGDAAACAAAIRRLLNDSQLRQQLGERARARIDKDFNAAKQLARIDALLAEVGRAAKAES